MLNLIFYYNEKIFTDIGADVAHLDAVPSLTRQITTPGIYAIRIHTVGGDLIGQSIVQ